MSFAACTSSSAAMPRRAIYHCAFAPRAASCAATHCCSSGCSPICCRMRCATRAMAGCWSRRGVALEVWDTGVGIPEDQREMIFREFYQIDNPERDRGRGLGMGLAIVQRLCNLLEHSLEVRSTIGRGSVFRVVVPAGDAKAIDAASVEADTLPPRKLGAVTVLLIDDEVAIREATRELLRP